MKSSKSKISFGQVLLISILAISIIACNQNGRQPSDEKSTTQPAKNEITSLEIPAWSKNIPDAELIKGTETYHDGMVTNVSNPTLKIYFPKKNTGVAILVFPGGGYNKLAIDLEGSEICEWLASIGVTGVLLKYRVPASGPHYDKECDCEKDPIQPLALQDAQRAMRLVRSRAEE